MKVLYFHQHFTIPTQAGGTRSYELAKHLIARGHSVCVVCGETVKLDLPNTTMKNVHRGMVDGIDVIQIALPYSNKDGIAKRAWTFVKFGWKGIQITLKEDYDLLFATSTPFDSRYSRHSNGRIFRRKNLYLKFVICGLNYLRP